MALPTAPKERVNLQDLRVKNSTALLTSVTGFEENPTDIFLTEMKNIVPEMQDLPFYHKGIECFCPKFVLFEEQWIAQY